MTAVVPCYNRRGDVQALLPDLARLDLQGSGRGIELRVIVVDNASDEPLATLPTPPGLAVEHVRLERNTGGSGGFNEGLIRALRLRDGQDEAAPAGAPGPGAEYIWLVDSDVRLGQGPSGADVLRALVRVLDGNADIVAAGSALADPLTGRIFEVGGRVKRCNGRFGPVCRGVAGLTGPIDTDYVAACSTLVRCSAIEAAGLMPDVFLNADDVQWCLRLASATGGRIAAVPDSVVFHPPFDRFPTAARYYTARNALGPIDTMGLGRTVRFQRALTEAGRACLQQMMARPDLARLHLGGLRDALAGRLTGAAPAETLACEISRPFDRLGEELRAGLAAQRAERLRGLGRERAPTLWVHPNPGISASDRERVREQLALAGIDPSGWAGGDATRRTESVLRRYLALAGRLVAGPTADVAMVPARGRPTTWIRGRMTVQVTQAGYVIRRPRPIRTTLGAAWTGLVGVGLAVRVMLKPRGFFVPPVVRAPRGPKGDQRGAPARPTVSVIVLSYNRWPALRATLESLLRTPALRDAEVVVVDNASSDGSPDLAAALSARVTVLRQASNVGVEAFNRGVEQSRGEVVLTLDDDACPDPGALDGALDLLVRRPDLDAVTLNPRHPRTGMPEWPFAGRLAAAGRTDDRWPVMGCGNLVRRRAWRRVGGYEAGYFLYRNDTDLALKLLATGPPGPAERPAAPAGGVHFNPAWVVWHDSPAAVLGGTGKSALWHRLATRNWVWTCRRHGGTVSGLVAGIMGWAWAHRLAGLGLRAHLATLQGAWEGLGRPSPPLPRQVRPTGEALGRLIRLRLGWER